MGGIQGTPFNDLNQNNPVARNQEEIFKKLGFIFSQENLGLQVRTIDFNTSAARKTCDVRDSVVLVDGTAGAFNITLAPANSWGAGKTPLIVVVRIDGTANAINIAASDLINGGGAVAVAGVGTVKRLITNSVNGWWLI